jgi:ribokinase
MAMARLLVIGSSNTDMTVRLPHLPAPGQTVLGGSLLSGPGGKGANQAVAAARAGAAVVFVTAVGDDDLGRLAVEGYRREGIDVAHIKTLPGVASGVALILVGEGGENMIGVAPGANARVSPDDVDRLPADLFRPDRALLVAGLEVPLDAVGRAVRRGASAGMTVVVNPAPALDGLDAAGWLNAVDVLTPNRVELGMLTGLPTETTEQVVEASRALRDRGPRAVVVTLGAEGCLVVDGATVQRIPSYPVVPVDTVGAGDAFSAALAVALAEGCVLPDAAAWASAAAALAVTKPGAQASLPRRGEIDRLAATSP